MRRVLILIVAAQLMFGIDATVVTVALPSIGRDLDLGLVGQAWVQTAYVVTLGGFLLLGSRLGDVVGRRRMLMTGVALFTVASLAGGLAPAGAWLIGCRVLQGAGAGLAGPNTMALLMLTHPAGPLRNHALGVYSAVLGTGASLGLILGAVLTAAASWRWGLLINVPVGLILCLLAPGALPETERQDGPVDLAGIGTSAIGLACLVLGLTNAASGGWTASTAVLPLVAATTLLTTFTLIERRAARPLVPLRLLAHPRRGAGYLAALLASGAMFGTFFLLTQFLQLVLRFDAIHAGLAFLAVMIPQLVLARLVPHAMKRLRAHELVLAGTLLMSAAMLWLGRLDGASSYLTEMLAPMVVLGVGGGLTFVPLSSIILAEVPPDLAGSASGVLQAAQYTGSALGVAILVGVLTETGRTQPVLARALATTVSWGTVLSVAVTVCAAYLLRKPRTQLNSPGPP